VEGSAENLGTHDVKEKNMANKLPRKALVAVSSFNGAIYPGGHRTSIAFLLREE
jgi:hypothetical protein